MESNGPDVPSNSLCHPVYGNHWHEASWGLHPVDDSRSASCLPDLIQPTYVLVMPGLLNEMAHRPHGLLEVTQGDICHVRATVLPPRINLPILQEFLKAFCRRDDSDLRCRDRLTLLVLIQSFPCLSFPWLLMRWFGPPNNLLPLVPGRRGLSLRVGLPVDSEGFRPVNQGSLSFNHPLSAGATLLRC